MWWYEKHIKQLKAEDKKKAFADVNNDRKVKRAQFQAMYASSSWRKLRKEILSIQPFCQMCIKEDRITKSYLVHHIKAAMDFPELFLEPTNLEGACLSCHSKHEIKEAAARRQRNLKNKGKDIMKQLFTKPKQ